jgi:hypothetical protein
MWLTKNPAHETVLRSIRFTKKPAHETPPFKTSIAEELHSMSAAAFEFPPEGHSFDTGDEIFVIDDNKYDILAGTVSKKSSRGYTVRFDDGDARSFKSTKRLLLRTSANTAIFESQQSLIRSAPPPPPSDDSPPRRSRSKPPVLSADFIVREAWGAGIRDAAGLASLLKDRTAEAVRIYEARGKLLAIDKTPLFSLGGGISETDAKVFWSRAKVQWNKLFGDEIGIPRNRFLRAVAEAVRLPQQTAQNAREILAPFFEKQEVGVTEFCLVLAQFGPGSAMMRKIGSYWKCSEKARHAIQGVNLGELGLDELAEVEGNSFEVETAAGGITLYNLVGVENDGQYLVDGDGKTYGSWVEFFEANPAASSEASEEEGGE